MPIVSCVPLPRLHLWALLAQQAAQLGCEAMKGNFPKNDNAAVWALRQAGAMEAYFPAHFSSKASSSCGRHAAILRIASASKPCVTESLSTSPLRTLLRAAVAPSSGEAA